MNVLRALGLTLKPAWKESDEQSATKRPGKQRNTSGARAIRGGEAFIESTLAKGRVMFTLTDLAEASGLTELAAKRQLARMGPKVVRVSPEQPFYLIVSPEYRRMGAPTPKWWLHDYLTRVGRPYYLALLSAASLHGSNPQAVKVTQVITDKPLEPIVVGRTHVRFFVKSAIEPTPTQQLAGGVAPLLISTPEATTHDLIRYASSIGGIERAAETIRPLLPLLRAKELKRVLEIENDESVAQRMGFVFDALGSKALSKTVREWLPDKLTPVALSPTRCKCEGLPLSKRWQVFNSSRELQA